MTVKSVLPQSSGRSLSDWLDELALRHPQHSIRLGLESMRSAISKLQLEQPQARVVTIAGTNGKGSCLMLLEAMLVAKGMRVGSFQSPHISHFCERIRINGAMVSEADVVAAFDRIDRHCCELELTFFEWNTLAALIIFEHSELDFVLLEVGLGGRLDAVNVIDNELALITSIDWDHTDWLGDSLEKIAAEKAGIIRPGGNVVSHSQISSIVNSCAELGARAIYWQQDFQLEELEGKHVFTGIDPRGEQVTAEVVLPCGCIADNLALALQSWLKLGFILTTDFVRDALATCTLPGRQQHIRIGNKDIILDVAHNRAGLTALSEKISREFADLPTVGLIGMLEDKEAIPDLQQLFPTVQHWLFISLFGARGQTAAMLADKLNMSDCELVDSPDSLSLAELMADYQLLIAMGSFHTCDRVRSMIAAAGCADQC